MASAGEEVLVDALMAAAQTLGRDGPGDTTVESTAEALVAIGCESIDTFAAWGNGCLMHDTVPPADLARMRARLAAAGVAGVVDDAALGVLVYTLVENARDKWLEARARKRAKLAPSDSPGSTGPASPATATTMTDDEKEIKKAFTCYDNLRDLNMREVDLPMRATFVGSARSSVETYGYIASVPSIGAVTTLGRAGAKGTRVRIGDSALNASISIGEKQPDLLSGMPAAHHACRVLVLGIGAALTVRINATAYGGRDCGWVHVPGETTQVRVMFTAAAIDRFLFGLLSIDTHDFSSFITTADRVVLEFLTIAARCTQHPDEIVDTLRDTKPHLYIPRGGDGDASVASGSGASGDSSTLEPNGTPPGAGKATCTAWLSDGSCKGHAAGTCPYGHGPAMRGAASNHRNSNRWQGQGWPAPAWTAQPQSWSPWTAPARKKPKAKGGGGKGGGGKGGGGKGGGGKGGWWW